ncbi:MAG: sulfatase-like hydrolase/transferase, partial [Bryobacteraceae bacterium]
MNRRSFLGSLLAGAAGARAQGRRPPNIVFMFSDDHAYQAISAYGAGLNRTPNIDRIANEGMIFRDCVVTNSICAPCRATVLTGKYSHMNGVIDNTRVFDGSQPTFPKLLRGSGYQTALFGKWHLKSDPTGFDSWEVLPGQGNYYNPDFLT